MQPHAKTYEQLLAELEQTQQALAHAESERGRMASELQAFNAELANQVACAVSAQQRAEAERDDLRAMFNQAPVLICVNEGPDHTYTLANCLYRSAFGGRELVGKALLEAVPEFEGQAHVEDLKEVYRTGVPHIANEVQATIRKRDGVLEEGYYNYILQPIRDDQGQVKDILTVGVEVTEQVVARHHLEDLAEALKRADKLKDEFLSVVSHELRTPVHILTGYLRLLMKDAREPLPDRQRAYVEKAAQTAADLAGIVSAILDFSQIQAGTLSLALETVALTSYLRDVSAPLSDLAASMGLTMAIAIPADLPAGRLDPLRIGQVLTNLVGNAVKFTPEGGAIRLTAQMRGGRLRVEVADTGGGIPAGWHARIFERFVQADMSMTRGKGGVGLGLAISRQLVEAHGGVIDVDSAPGNGSTFWFELPLGGPEASGE